MESLLSLSFDNLTCKDVNKVRKGLRQIEGLLAQICLNRSRSNSPAKKSSPTLSACTSLVDVHQLSALAEDLAFQEFFRLQESFEWNGDFCETFILAHRADAKT